MKDTDKLPDEEVHSMRLGRVPQPRNSVPTVLRCTIFPAGCSATKSSPDPTVKGLLQKFHHLGMNDY